jgi:transcription elongation factor Elf1
MASTKPPRRNSMPPGRSIPPGRKSSLSMKAVQLPKTITFMVTDGEKSTCPVCGGDVVSGSEVVETERGHRQKDLGIFCTSCGIRFEFMPPKKGRKK